MYTAHCHVDTRVLLVTEQMMHFNTRLSDVVVHMAEGLTPTVSTLRRGSVIDVVLSDQVVERRQIASSEPIEHLTNHIDRSSSLHSSASQASRTTR